MKNSVFLLMLVLLVIACKKEQKAPNIEPVEASVKIIEKIIDTIIVKELRFKL